MAFENLQSGQPKKNLEKYFDPKTATDEEFEAYASAEEDRAGILESNGSADDAKDIRKGIEEMRDERRNQTTH